MPGELLGAAIGVCGPALLLGPWEGGLGGRVGVSGPALGSAKRGARGRVGGLEDGLGGTASYGLGSFRPYEDVGLRAGLGLGSWGEAGAMAVRGRGGGGGIAHVAVVLLSDDARGVHGLAVLTPASRAEAVAFLLDLTIAEQAHLIPVTRER